MTTLYDEVMALKTEREQLMLISKQRKYIKDYLDIVNLKYEPHDITLIREQLEYGYRSIDVVIAYASIYRDKYESNKFLRGHLCPLSLIYKQGNNYE